MHVFRLTAALALAAGLALAGSAAALAQAGTDAPAPQAATEGASGTTPPQAPAAGAAPAAPPAPAVVDLDREEVARRLGAQGYRRVVIAGKEPPHTDAYACQGKDDYKLTLDDEARVAARERVGRCGGRESVAVRAPLTDVDVKDGDVHVRAPYTSVDVDRKGVRVRAPFVDITIPR